MEAISSVGKNAYVDLLNYTKVQNSTAAVNTISSFGEDSVELSDESLAAYRLSESLNRSTSMMRQRGISDQDIGSFREIIKRGESREGAAKDFLKSLSYDERDLVKRVNSYGSRLTDANIDRFSEEGCVNMLVEQEYRSLVDLNGDNLIDVGAGKTFAFPPQSAPEKVKDVWDEMSKEMTFVEKMMFTIQFIPINIPGHPDATLMHGNNFSRDGYPQTIDGWSELFGDVYESLEYQNKIDPDPLHVKNRKKTMEHLQEFIKRLDQ